MKKVFKSIGEAGLSQESSMDSMDWPTNAKSILEFCHSAYIHSLIHMISILHVAAQSNIIGTDVLCYGGGSAYVRLPVKPISFKSMGVLCWLLMSGPVLGLHLNVCTFTKCLHEVDLQWMIQGKGKILEINWGEFSFICSGVIFWRWVYSQIINGITN